MEAWAAEFFDVWQANRVELANIILAGIQENPYIPYKGYSFDDIIQMFDGTRVMMMELVAGESTDIWDTYMGSVIPGLLAQGLPLSALVGQVSVNGILTYKLLVPLISEPNRAAAGIFVQNWFYKVNAATVLAGLEFGAKA